MKKLILLLAFAILYAPISFAQRYVNEVFTDAQIDIQSDVVFATNIDFLISSFSNQAKVVADITELKTNVALGNPQPAKFYNPSDTNSVVKVTDLKMDLYYPNSAADTATARPLVIYVHTGNFLPPPLNGSPQGTKNDSSATNMSMLLAKRGYVVASINYRLGWNPLGTTVWERRGTLLNAVYRAIHDTKMSVRFMRENATGPNDYKINPNQIILYGEGSGAYVTNAYGSMDKFSELELPKFINPATSKSIIDTTRVGNLDGYNGLLNLYVDNGFSAEVQALVATGGAFADTSWMEAGDPPIIAVQCVRDPFAPFIEGVVVVPTTGEDVVEVQGANLYVAKANVLGNNDGFNSSSKSDAYTLAARSRYGKTFKYIYATQPNITVSSNVENMFPVLRPLGASVYQNEASPWQWWDPESPIAKTVIAAPDITAHKAALASNPDMSPTKGRTYLDTVVNYICPRIADLFDYYVSVNDLKLLTGISVSPNPANNETLVSVETGSIATAVVIDAMGREVYRFNDVNSGDLAINTTNLTSGVYFIQIYTKDGLGTARLLKE